MGIKSLLPLKPPIQSDLAQTLGQQGIHIILELIRDAYFDLEKLNVVTEVMDENDITEEWFIYLQLRWKAANLALVPIHEKPDKFKKVQKMGKPPTIDCCFRNQWSKQSYFGIECKLIEAENKWCDKYIDNGVKRFTGCTYSSECSQGAMLGYVRKTQCSDVAEKIKERLAKLPDNPSLNQTRQLIPFKEHYTSRHKRTDCISPFTLHHFFLSFNVSNIVESL